MARLIPVIISGGAGTRLWPVSREAHPKPFMKLADGQSLLKKTFLRALALSDVNEVLTVTSRETYFQTEDEYRGSNVTDERIATRYVLEPFGRNTAPAITAAALCLQDTFGPTATMLVLPADHVIADQDAFAGAVAMAIKLAQCGNLVTFGIKPDCPETGFGYIETGTMLESAAGVSGPEGFSVKRFVEKPSIEVAEQYVASPRFLWNSGMFCFMVGAFLEEMRSHAPEVVESVQACLRASRSVSGDRTSVIELEASSFGDVPDISIDYALMEKSPKVAVVACRIGWSDVGSWSAVAGLSKEDRCGNRVTGEALLHDVANCYIQSGGRVVGAVGVENLIIVDTPDALLVADRSRAQDVKFIAQKLKQSGHAAYKAHRQVHRPWGTYTVIEEGSRFKIKRIVVKPGASLSLQMHHHRSEHWIVVSGTARVVNGTSDLLVATNESTFIPAGHRHRVANPGVVSLVMIEVQSGDYLGEDDIVRFEDSYGRA
jgi:mannose-1-phosphate guanylyltransferase